jgi:hypothetical protein
MRITYTIIFASMIMSLGAQNFPWTAQNSGTDAALNDLQLIDPMHGWAAGDRGTIVLPWMEVRPGLPRPAERTGNFVRSFSWIRIQAGLREEKVP